MSRAMDALRAAIVDLWAMIRDNLPIILGCIVASWVIFLFTALILWEPA